MRPKSQNFDNTSKEVLITRYWAFYVVHHFIWDLKAIVLWKQFFLLYLVQRFSKIEYFDSFLKQKAFYIISTTELQKAVKSVFLENYLFEIFFDVQCWYWKTCKFCLIYFLKIWISFYLKYHCSTGADIKDIKIKRRVYRQPRL